MMRFSGALRDFPKNEKASISGLLINVSKDYRYCGEQKFPEGNERVGITEAKSTLMVGQESTPDPWSGCGEVIGELGIR